MTTTTTAVPAAAITVAAADWHAYLNAATAARAAEKEAAARKAVLLGHLADKEVAVRELMATAETGATAVFLDGNGNPLGKLSLYWRDQYTVGAGFVMRIS
jgi:hypothetical protein